MRDMVLPPHTKYLVTAPLGGSFVQSAPIVHDVILGGISPRDYQFTDDGLAFVVQDEEGAWLVEPVKGPFEHTLAEHYTHIDLATGEEKVRQWFSAAVRITQAAAAAEEAAQKAAKAAAKADPEAPPCLFEVTVRPWLLVNNTIVVIDGTREVARYVPVRVEA